jgi:hypothetical protein
MKVDREDVVERTAQGGIGFPRPWAWTRVDRERERAIWNMVKKCIF